MYQKQVSYLLPLNIHFHLGEEDLILIKPKETDGIQAEQPYLKSNYIPSLLQNLRTSS